MDRQADRGRLFAFGRGLQTGDVQAGRQMRVVVAAIDLHFRADLSRVEQKSAEGEAAGVIAADGGERGIGVFYRRGSWHHP